MAKALKKFSTQADEELLKEIKVLAEKEGKQFQVLVNEAFEDLVDIMAHFEKSLEDFDELYKELAK
ncbi:MAG: hypothetical protein UR30_C0005G0122 [Candidatus Peregrinibacteria bacterium GW2011_GWC2_33_13]|nr:MAG: hypothetical protein UR30_C0005G0122 [Candidatus Peregrinibacteria bacterium GW2011_GWC2_33_13]